MPAVRAQSRNALLVSTFEIWLLLTTAIALATGLLFDGYHVVFVFALSALLAGMFWAISWRLKR